MTMRVAVVVAVMAAAGWGQSREIQLCDTLATRRCTVIRNADVSGRDILTIKGTGANPLSVGIGVDPESALDVAGTVRAVASLPPTSGEGLETAFDTTNHFGRILAYDRSGSAYRDLRIGRDSGAQLALLASGEVGINTTTPSSRFHVNGTSTLQLTLPQTHNSYDMGSITNAWRYGYFQGAVGSKKYQFYDNGASDLTGPFWFMDAIETVNTKALRFLDDSSNPILQLYRLAFTSPINRAAFDADVDPAASNTRDLGASLPWRSLYLGTGLYMGGTLAMDSARNLTVGSISASTVSAGAIAGTLLTGSSLTLSGLTSAGVRCVEATAAGLLQLATAGCATGVSGVTSMSATSPITVSASSGAVDVACPDCMRMSTSQTVTGVKNWAVNQTFASDNTYYIGNSSQQAAVIYGRAIQSRKFQFEDAGGFGSFWYAATSVVPVQTFQLVDAIGTQGLVIATNGTGAPYTQLRGPVSSLSGSNVYDLGTSGNYWRSLYLGTGLYMGGSLFLDGSRNVTAATVVTAGLTSTGGTLLAGASVIGAGGASTVILINGGSLNLRTQAGAPSCSAQPDGQITYDSSGDRLYVCQGGVARIH